MVILVIGDSMIDVNYFSKIERFCPESNTTPIHNIMNTTYILGGAANVANNLNKLIPNTLFLSIIGDDYYGEKLLELLNDSSINCKLFKDSTRCTTQKHRIFNNNKLSVRYDIENTTDISDDLSNEILKYIFDENEKNHIDVIVISDYAKGVITKYLCENVIKFANDNNIYTFVDPKLKNFDKYKYCFCIKPNLIEAEQITNSKNISEMFTRIKEYLDCKNILITASEKGMYVNNVENHITHIDKINVVDVTGAGDIALSVFIYSFLKEKNMYISSKVSNVISGKSTQVIGNYLLHKNEVDEVYNMFSNTNNKIIFDNEIEKLSSLQNKNVVFTNGCFDIVHSAHLKLLNYCKTKGDILVVGINSDNSIKRLKGEKRPINNISERTDFLLNLNFIDYIVVFNEDTPYNIINLIKPDIIVKGGDYKPETVVGHNIVKEVCIFDYISNKSTSLTISKILDSNT